MLEKKFGDFLFASLPDENRTCPRYVCCQYYVSYAAQSVDFYFSFGSLISFCVFFLKCISCLEGTLIFKVSRFGAGYFIGCDQHPRCK